MGKRVDVPLSVRQRIETVVDECVKKAEAHYKRMIKTPDVKYELTGAVAGRAHTRPEKWFIDINSVLLMENLEDMIANTVPHEMAHMICKIVYPETLAVRGKVVTSTGRMKREKREVHGPRFYEVCDVIGMTDAGRTHDYDISNAKKKVDTTRHTYVCLTCNQDVVLSAKQHTMMLNGTRKYHHRTDSGMLVLKQNMKFSMVGTQPIITVASPKPINQGKLAPTSGKIGICWVLYKRFRDRYDRKSMIAVFVNEADCTPAGASTYYATCQKMFREGYI